MSGTLALSVSDYDIGNPNPVWNWAIGALGANNVVGDQTQINLAANVHPTLLIMRNSDGSYQMAWVVQGNSSPIPIAHGCWNIGAVLALVPTPTISFTIDLRNGGSAPDALLPVKIDGATYSNMTPVASIALTSSGAKFVTLGCGGAAGSNLALSASGATAGKAAIWPWIVAAVLILLAIAAGVALLRRRK